MTVSFSRQIATAAAAFFLTAVLILANAPDQAERDLRFDRSAASVQVLTVLTRHG